MRTKLLIAAAGLVGLAALPSAAQAQPWGGYGFYRPYPPPFYRPRPFWPPPPFYRPRVFYPPPIVYAPPPPPVVYAPPLYRPAPVYVAPPVTYRSHVVHRPVRRAVQPAAVPCSCAAPSTSSAPAPAPTAPSLPALRPAPSAPSNNVYPPERVQ
ncbi:MAG: hypothetical protein JOZ05_01060 [Acetobacteraceae bacterium]|nr:hypothetical protein [Acetobacteraceae bacterium]